MKNGPNKERSLARSSAVEYLTFVAAQGQGGVEVVYADEDIWKDFEWHALGAAIEGSYAVAWFGVEADE